MTLLLVPLACGEAPDEPLAEIPVEVVEAPPSFEETDAVEPALDVRLVELAAAEDWGALSTETGPLASWALVKLDRPADAELIEGFPAPQQAWANGRIHLAKGDPNAAVAELEQVPEGHPLHRSALASIAATEAARGDLARARAAYSALVAEPDPAAGSAEALAALAAMAPDPEPYERRLWAHYPNSAEDPTILADATWQEAAWRADALQAQGAWSEILELLGPFSHDAYASDHVGTEDACRFRYVQGRAYYKKGRRPEAVKAFGNAAQECDGETGAKLAYLKGKTHLLRGQHNSAAAVWERMAEDFPEHSFADDGLVLAGVAKERSGDIVEARRLWQKAIDELPDGDMIPEAMFRTAWSHYQAGDGAEAARIAAELGKLPPSRDRFHVPAGMYWAGRWALYPKVSDPTTPNEAGREAALSWWTRCIESQPWSFYAVLAQSRMAEESMPVLVELPEAETTWTLSREVLDSDLPALLSLGLVEEAISLHGEHETWSPDEMGWWTESRMAVGDAVDAHRSLRTWLRTNTPVEPSPEVVHLLSVAYPDLWLEEVEAASADYRFEPRYFHSLVRVESNFDEDAISWAGARGLCQVMPATGKGVGEWMGMKVGRDDLLDPEINLKVGARYMEFLHSEFEDSPYLSAAGYNAGEHRVGQWLDEWGNIPTDEYCERIPFDETRGYVKRVVGTWQAYTWLHEGRVMTLAQYNHRALATAD
ncbi:MAG TPA: transglycosylase SLT domain-containing protein [Myxococcota bacterium]|nr:transglycosylase SLT domain-containing protein [Myxococcota bacterium]